MSDYSLDTKAPADHHVVLNGQRYAVIGITRTISRTAAEKQSEARTIREEMEASTNGHLPELQEQAARLMIETAALRLRAEDGAEPAGDLLTRLWDADELEIDRHLDPLLHHLFGEETQPVPPA